MRRIFLIVVAAATLACIGQYCLPREWFSTGWIAIPGFFIGMLLVIDGEPGETAATPYIEITADTIFYFLLILAIIGLVTRFTRRPTP